MARPLLLAAAVASLACSRQPPAPAPVAQPPAAVAHSPVEAGKSPFGALSLTCTPDCRLWLDGEDTGFDAPIRGMPLRAGTHQLRVVSRGGASESLSFYLPPGGTYERAFPLPR